MRYLQVPILQVSHPKGLLAVVEGQHGLHSVHEELQALLQSRHMVGQAGILINLKNNALLQGYL